MSSQGWHENVSPFGIVTDGPTLTAAAAASAIPVVSKFAFQSNYFVPGKKLKIVAQGRISNAATTPGTGRFDIRLGGSVVFDTGAFNLNVVAKTNVPWWLEIDLKCRTIGTGTGTTFLGFAEFVSEALVGSPLPSAGGNGGILLPVGAPVVGAGVDVTSALTFDMFWTQTVATGSMTMHELEVVSRN